ncbi:MAG: alanine racemase [Candidatus Cloacimonas sp. 4484_275]|nr:MAG: alanine racemase [Candidatus Cloacimonas sp. 4484_275]
MKTERSWTEINLSNFEYNLRELKKFLPENVQMMQIVKADAYGHGAFEIAKKAQKFGINFFGVANAEEGSLLRYLGIDCPILILSPSLLSEIEIILENNLIPSVSTIDFAEALNFAANKRKKKQKIHLNIDTGMGRSGIDFRVAAKTIEKIRKFSNLQIEGIFSHFSAAENDSEYTNLQATRFSDLLKNLSFKPKFIHISNSSGVVTFTSDFQNLVRIGLLSYGVYSDNRLKNQIDLKAVMTFKSRISQIKTAAKGDSIGYNRTFIASENMKYAILPVGYADGYDFLLSNKGKVLIRKKVCSVIGKVSMDMIAVDISDLKNPQVGEIATLLGEGNEQIRAENIASLYGGSSYEILCQIGRRAKRYYYENGKVISSSPLLRRNFVSSDYSDKKLSGIIETAIEQRLQSKEIADLIYRDILKRFFIEKDREIYYRKNFVHTVKFSQVPEGYFSRQKGKISASDYFLVNTRLTFTKKLQNDYFLVACAKNEKLLEKYFLRRDVEYRWLLNDNFDLNKDFFAVTSVFVNDLELKTELKISQGCIEIKCSHPYLKNLVGKEVDFSISTKTFYPQASHQLGIYLTEITRGVQIDFIFDGLLRNVEAVPIFSGRLKFPQIEYKKNSISVYSQNDEWIFPNSGVIFVY